MAGVIAAGGTSQDRRKYWDDQVGGAASVTSYAAPTAIGLILLLGVIGNGSIIYTVCKHRRMKNVPNAFVVNIAVADLLLLFLSSPFVAAYYVFDNWLLGAFVCKMAEATQTFSVALSTLSITALSIERYCAFASPPRRRRVARRRACVGILVMWILAAVAALPDAMSALVEHKGVGERTTKRCSTFTEAWGPLYPRIHTIVSACVLFGVPLVLVNVFYMSLGCVVCGKKRRDRRRQARGGGGSETLQLKAHGGHANGDGPQRNGTLPSSKVGAVSTFTRTGTLSGQVSGGTLARGGEQPGTLRSYRDTDAHKKDSKTSLLRQKSKKRKTMAKVAVCMCFQFIFFWAPRYAYRGWFYFDAPGANDEDVSYHWAIVKHAGLGAIFFNAAVVPFTIISFNRAFRRRLSKYLCCCCSSCSACCCADDDDESTVGGKRGGKRSAAATRCPCCWDDRDSDGDDDDDDDRDLESDYQTTGAYRPRYMDAYEAPQQGPSGGDLALLEPSYEYGVPAAGLQAAEGPYGARALNDYGYLHRPYDSQYAEPALLRINPIVSGYLHPEQQQYADVRHPSSAYRGAEDGQQTLQKAVGAATTASDNVRSQPEPPPPPAMFDGELATAGAEQAPGVYI